MFWIQLPRRAFLGLCLAAPFARRLSGAEAPIDVTPPVAPRLWARLPAELRYIRQPIDEANNAWPLWKEAFERYQNCDPILYEGNALEADAPYPTGAEAEATARWLEANSETLRFFEDGIRRGQVQRQDILLKPSDISWIQIVRNATRLMQLRIRQHAAQGKFQDAADNCAPLLRTGEMIVSSEDFLVSALVGFALYGSALTTIRYLASDRRAPPGVVRSLLRVVEQSEIPRGRLAVTQKVELCYFALPLLDRIPDEAPLDQLVESLLKNYGGDMWELPNTRHLFDDQQERRNRREGLLRLLDGHPRPFDKLATVDLLADQECGILAYVAQPWMSRRPRSSPETAGVVAAWPKQFSFVWPFDHAKMAPPTAAEVEAARSHLLQVTNPVGKFLTGDAADDPFWSPRKAYEHLLLNRAATSLVLALRLYEAAHGHLPASLTDLIKEKLLTTLPLDPFGDGPLGYSAEQKSIWSVGPDGDYQPRLPLPEDEWGPDLQRSLVFR